LEVRDDRRYSIYSFVGCGDLCAHSTSLTQSSFSRANLCEMSGYINSFRRVSHAVRPEHGGENMTAVWASYHKERCSDGVVVPHGFDPLIGPALGVVLDRCNPLGAAVDAVLEAATHARRAERTADGGVVSVPQVLHVSLHAPRINAQRV